MDNVPSFQPQLDQLIAFASSEERKPDLLAAKAEYFGHTGDVFEDDKSFEHRMASFLDYYVFDRISPLTAKTPAQEYYQQIGQTAPADEAAVFRNFTETHHGLFEVKRLGKGILRLRDLFTDKDYEVTERRQVAGLEKGDVMEARLIPLEGNLLFSTAFIYHPREAIKLIRSEVKRLRKKVPDHSPQAFAWDCARRALKADRYRQIPVEKIYDFEGRQVL
jgi:hypothetical protein